MCGPDKPGNGRALVGSTAERVVWPSGEGFGVEGRQFEQVINAVDDKSIPTTSSKTSSLSVSVWTVHVMIDFEKGVREVVVRSRTGTGQPGHHAPVRSLRV